MKTIEIPETGEVTRFGSEEAGDAWVLIVRGSSPQVELIRNVALSAIAEARRKVDGPSPCQGCGNA